MKRSQTATNLRPSLSEQDSGSILAQTGRTKQKNRHTETINKMVKDLLNLSIPMIIQTSNEVYFRDEDAPEVFIVFQQSYHTKRMKKPEIDKILGTDLCFNKIDKGDQILELQIDKRLMFCHYCMKSKSLEQLQFCNNFSTEERSQSFGTFNQLIRTRGKFHDSAAISYNINSYFRSYRATSSQDSCNRGYCKQCIQKLQQNESNRYKKKKRCYFCQRKCTCQRCVLAKRIVQYIHNENLLDMAKELLQKLCLFEEEQNHRLLSIQPLRKRNEQGEFNIYRKYLTQKPKHIIPKIVVPLRLNFQVNRINIFSPLQLPDFSSKSFEKIEAQKEDEDQHEIRENQSEEEIIQPISQSQPNSLLAHNNVDDMLRLRSEEDLFKYEDELILRDYFQTEARIQPKSTLFDILGNSTLKISSQSESIERKSHQAPVSKQTKPNLKARLFETPISRQTLERSKSNTQLSLHFRNVLKESEQQEKIEKRLHNPQRKSELPPEDNHHQHLQAIVQEQQPSHQQARGGEPIPRNQPRFRRTTGNRPKKPKNQSYRFLY